MKLDQTDFLREPPDFTPDDFDYWGSVTTQALNVSHEDSITQWTEEGTNEMMVTLTQNDLIRLVKAVAEKYTGS